MRVVFTVNANEAIGQYYERYQKLPTGGTDLERRSDNYRKIVRELGCVDQDTSQTRVKNGKNFIDIDGVATVEYTILQAKGLVIAKNIYFIDAPTKTQTTIRQTNNFNNNTQWNRQQPQYTPVSNNYCFGLRIVKSNNGLFNYVNKNNQIFYPHRWFKNAEDFKEWDNGVIAARVFDGTDRYFLTLENPMLHPIGKGDYLTDCYHIVLGKILQEQMFYRNRDKYQSALEQFNFTLNYDPAVGGQLPQKWDF